MARQELGMFSHAGKIQNSSITLRSWGEAGTIKTKTCGTPAIIADQGAKCMMIGYATNHQGDSYSMWDPKMDGAHETRDIIWMHWMFYEQDIGQDDVVPVIIIPGIDDPILTMTPADTLAETWEGTGNMGTESILTREEGEACGMDNPAVPEQEESESEPVVEAANRLQAGQAQHIYLSLLNP
jgi:hypothetical protein